MHREVDPFSAAFMACFFFCLPWLATAEDVPHPIEFNRDVRPILSDNCWACHGPDANKRKSDLRLDLHHTAVQDAIVPGDAAASPLVKRIFSDDPEEVMPPAEHRKKLSATQKEILKTWVAQGAKRQDHWAWIPPEKATGESIDGFIEPQLVARGLGFSDAADSYTLMRRLSFDLRGLPPTAEEMATFTSWEKLVDDFLASSAFGERLAVYWLDLVRYADTNGYHADIEWTVSPYRDYVITAFNKNMPFDQFTREQIAGDLIPEATSQQRVAAGFNRLNMKSTEFGIQDKEYLAKYAADRVRTTATTWLGVTLGCAECHDHKFDPFTARDFYNFAAFFADIKGLGYYPDAQKKGWGETMEVPEGDGQGVTVVLPDSRKAGQIWQYTEQKPTDGWGRQEFDASGWKSGEAGFGSKGTPGGSIRSEWKSADIWLRRSFSVAEIPQKLFLQIQHDEDATVYLNNKEVARLTGYSNATPEYVRRALDPTALQKGQNTIAIHCHQTSGGQFIDAGLSSGNIPISARKMLATVSVKPRVMRVLPRGNWMDDSGEVVQPATPAFLSSGDRGIPPARQKEASETLPPRSLSRSDLASWITARNNPLTARVFVNRLWKLYFGTGLARMLDDIGSQSEWPSHPELLDWLAVEFMESGWDVKHMVKLIVMSRAYQQSSLESDSLRELDPGNRLLARQSRFRLEAEFIRDNALAVSGLLDRRVGGRSVKPYQPGEYWENLNFPRRAYVASKGPDQFRRGVYTHWQRQFLHPALLAFDAPSREECTADRPRSNTPLAALVLLNDPTQIEAARALAEATLMNAELSGDRARIGSMITRVLTRPGREAEVEVLSGLLKKHRAEFAADPESARRLVAIGQHPTPKRNDPADLAPWISVARTLLNLHETITRN